MKTLNILFQGQFIKKVPLAEGHSYIVGRDPDCDIYLDQDKALSRQHLKMTVTGNFLVLEILSKYGEFSFKGEFYSNCQISVNDSIQIGMYSLQFAEDALSTSQGDQTFTVNSFDEKTIVSEQHLVGFVKIYKADVVIGEIKLSGTNWVAGRDSSCQIVILDPRVSRKQFEISYLAGEYFIKDLGSVNGTELNSQIITDEALIKLNSGDTLQILDNKIVFEVRDPMFEQKAVHVDQNHSLTLLRENQALTASRPQREMTSASPQNFMEKVQKFDFKKNKKSVYVAVIALIGVIVMLQELMPDSKPAPQANKKISPIDKLKPEQQSFIRQTYNLAKNLYYQGKYELAKQEILKIQQYVPEYEDSKQLELYMDEAIRIKADQLELERLAKQKKEIEEKIQAQYDICTKLLNLYITEDKMTACLSPAIELNPQHSLVLELQKRTQELIEQKNAKDVETQNYLSDVNKLQSFFNRAEGTYKRGEFLQALDEYRKVLNSKLPDPSSVKGASQRRIASIQKNIAEQVESSYKKADQLVKGQNYKGAILELRKAEKVDPNNEDIKSKIMTHKNILKKILMEKYQEAILEESVGNVPTAIPKWKEIINLDVNDGEYYLKAKIKLKKYGAF